MKTPAWRSISQSHIKTDRQLLSVFGLQDSYIPTIKAKSQLKPSECFWVLMMAIKKKMKTAYVNRLTLIEKNVNPTIVCVANRRRRGWVVGKFVFLGVFEFFSLYYLFGFGWVINMFKWYLLLETALCLALALPMGLYLSDTFRFTTFAAYNVFFTLWTTFPISLWLGFWKFFVATAIGFVFHLTRFVVVAIVLVFYFLLFLLFYFFFLGW